MTSHFVARTCRGVDARLLERQLRIRRIICCGFRWFCLVLFVMVGHEREVAAAVVAVVAAAAVAAAAAASVSVASVPRRWASPLRLEGTVEPDFLPLLLLTGGWGREGRSSHEGGLNC